MSLNPDFKLHGTQGGPLPFGGKIFTAARAFRSDEPIELVLTADRAALSHSLNGYRAWGGELRFGPLQIFEYREVTPTGSSQKITHDEFFTKLEDDLRAGRIPN